MSGAIRKLKLLDCFCGKGGVSIGFYELGYDCTGIDIKDYGYPYNLIIADFTTLNGSDFQEYDVIWGSPPCRDFSLFAKRFGRTWKKNPPNPQKGLILVEAFLKFVEDAKPKYWIMENTPGLMEYLTLKPEVITALGNPSKSEMRRAFWGNFPYFLIPKSKRLPMRYRKEVIRNQKEGSYRTRADRAKIPLACSKAFAKAIHRRIRGGS